MSSFSDLEFAEKLKNMNYIDYDVKSEYNVKSCGEEKVHICGQVGKESRCEY